VLATPPAGRLALVESILRTHPVRALVLEKPAALALTEAQAIVDRCRAAGVQVVVGHQLRFCPEFVALKDAVERGELGAVRSLSGWCHGNLLDQGPHLLDLARWLAGDRDALWVMSQQCSDAALLERLAPGSTARGEDGAHPAPPWMVHHVAFAGGVRATIETGPLHQRSGTWVDEWLQKRVLVRGSEGWAEAQAAGYFRMVRDDGTRRELAGTLAGYHSATRRLHEALRDALVDGGPHRADARDALRSLELVMACAQSAVDGNLVALPVDRARDPVRELAAARGATGPRPATPAPVAARVAEPGSAPEFSVVLPLPDHRGHAVACLRSWIAEQTFGGDRYEVILVDDGADSPLAERLRGLLRPHDRLLRVRARNELEMYHRGAEAARGRFLLFTESHCTAEPECLAELSAYLARTDVAGACLRSVSGDQPPMARLEDRMFKESFRTWSQPGDWRKVIMRGFALRRDVYREVGGFEHRFDRFAELALAATLHARGVVLGYAPGAAVRHFDSVSFAELFPPVASFTHGECAYRAERPAAYCDRYFGSPPEWRDRLRLRPEVAREVARAAWRGLWRDGWRHGAGGVAFALTMAREVASWLPSALLGARPHLLRARLRLLRARVRLLLGRGDEARYRAYLRLWDAMVTLARVTYLASRPPAPAPGDGPPGGDVDLAEVVEDALVGFHDPETWNGRSFRWMRPLGVVRLHLAPGEYEVVLDTGGVAGDVPRPLAVSWNGHRVPALRTDGTRARFRISAGWFVSGPVQTLAIASAALRPLPPERRRLALPLARLTLRPAAAPPAGGSEPSPAPSAAPSPPARGPEPTVSVP
jgi:predicted dehydrogenase/glycosyltransferase involved in cell wall biosynthesis